MKIARESNVDRDRSSLHHRRGRDRTGRSQRQRYRDDPGDDCRCRPNEVWAQASSAIPVRWRDLVHVTPFTK
jgi:hypothetical protein